MVKPAARLTLRTTAPRLCKKEPPLRLADELGAGASDVLPQKQGRDASAHTPQAKGMRGRSGFSRWSRKGSDRKLGADVVTWKPFAALYGSKRFTLSLRKRGAVAGIGLFAEARIRKREVLGVFTGQYVSKAVAAQRRARGAKSILEFIRDGKVVYLDGSKGKKSCFSWLNSSRGISRTPNAEFVVIEGRVAVQTLRAVEPDTELLVDYDWARALAPALKRCCADAPCVGLRRARCLREPRRPPLAQREQLCECSASHFRADAASRRKCATVDGVLSQTQCWPTSARVSRRRSPPAR